jgi:hypothetical protein
MAMADTTDSAGAIIATARQAVVNSCRSNTVAAITQS